MMVDVSDMNHMTLFFLLMDDHLLKSETES